MHITVIADNLLNSRCKMALCFASESCVLTADRLVGTTRIRRDHDFSLESIGKVGFMNKPRPKNAPQWGAGMAICRSLRRVPSSTATSRRAPVPRQRAHVVLDGDPVPVRKLLGPLLPLCTHSSCRCQRAECDASLLHAINMRSSTPHKNCRAPSAWRSPPGPAGVPARPRPGPVPASTHRLGNHERRGSSKTDHTGTPGQPAPRLLPTLRASTTAHPPCGAPQMVQFIKQEAEEKANEIAVAAEEVRPQARRVSPRRACVGPKAHSRLLPLPAGVQHREAAAGGGGEAEDPEGL